MTFGVRDVDRRRTRRFVAHAQGVDVTIRPGHGATIVNMSAAGALLETGRRLLPGTFVELRMDIKTDQPALGVRALVVRCSVVRVRAATVFYHGAVAFDRHLPWFVGADGYAVPGAEQRASLPERVDVTRPVI